MKSSLRSKLDLLFLSATSRVYPSLYVRKKTILTTFFLYFFIIISLTFIGFAIVNKEYLFLPADTFSLLLSIILLYFLKVRNYLNEVIVIFITFICLISTLFILSGGANNTGLLTATLIPIPIILLLGKKKGLWVLISFLIINALGFLFLVNNEWFPDYDLDLLGRITLIFIIISLMAYVNEFVFDQLYLRLERITDSFKTSQERYKNLATNREKFLSIISHDLSGHLENFSSVSNTLNKKYNELQDEDKRRLVSQMSIISEQNFKLLRDLLKWSTVQNETIPYSPVPVKLERIYREIIELFHPVIEDKKIAVFLKMKSNFEVYADYDMLSSILRNLVSNAIKYCKHEGEIRITATESNHLMLISVSDNGIGMNDKDLQKLNASVTFSNPGTFDETGIGIGLILVKEFVQKNHGEFFIESKLGEGTEASFTIPLAE